MSDAPLSVHLPSSLTKRSRSQDSKGSSAGSATGDEQDNPRDGENGSEIPTFLCQSHTDIRAKFEELEWLQRGRLAQGQLSNDASHQWALEATPEVRNRSRYINVQAWANSRIHLKVPEGECDFINASPISLNDVRSGEDWRYIAAQGPKEEYLADFWSMVFHETGDVAVIVMLTQTIEGGREKCAQYFPVELEDPVLELRASEQEPPAGNESDEDKEEPAVVGKLTLLDSSFDETTRSEIRQFELTIGTEAKTVWHYLFAGWADFSKPEGDDRQALLELIQDSATKAGSPQNPRIVHCSAGVGRTGTFIALDFLLRELESEQLFTTESAEQDVIYETVNRLREQRMCMVYNELQMQFLYEVLREQTESRMSQAISENDNGADPDAAEQRSAKAPRLSITDDGEDDYEPASKPELVPIGDDDDSKPTPTGSDPATPEVIDNEVLDKEEQT